MVYNYQQELFLWRHHNLVFPGPESHESQVVVGILFLEESSRRRDDLVHHVGVGLGGLGVQAGFDRSAVGIENETATHGFGLAQILELLFDFGGHGGAAGRLGRPMLRVQTERMDLIKKSPVEREV